MTLIWRQDTNPGDFVFAEFTNYLELCGQGLRVNRCVPVPAGLPAPTVVSKAKGSPTDFFFGGFALVASSRLRTLLEDVAIPAEYVRVQLTHNGQQVREPAFFLVNILEAVGCLDYTRSTYTTTPTGIVGIEDLIIDESRALGHHLFRLGPIGWAESPNPRAVGEVILCASEELARRCEAEGITGVVFSLPNERNVYPPPAWEPSE